MCEYVWKEKVTKSGRVYSELNDNPQYIVFHETGLFKTLWVAEKKFGNTANDIEGMAMVEGLFDHFSLPKEKRWMNI